MLLAIVLAVAAADGSNSKADYRRRALDHLVDCAPDLIPGDGGATCSLPRLRAATGVAASAHQGEERWPGIGQGVHCASTDDENAADRPASSHESEA